MNFNISGIAQLIVSRFENFFKVVLVDLIHSVLEIILETLQQPKPNYYRKKISQDPSRQISSKASAGVKNKANGYTFHWQAECITR